MLNSRLLKENIGENLHDVALDSDFLDMKAKM